MKQRLWAFLSGLHFRFLSLVAGLAVLILAAQLVTDTYIEMGKQRELGLNEAMGVASAVARGLEKDFGNFDPGEIETMMAALRSRGSIRSLSVIGRDHAVLYDGTHESGPQTASVIGRLHDQAVRSGLTAVDEGGPQIRVAEPILARAGAVGSVLIGIDMPGFWHTLVSSVRAKLSTMVPILIIGLLLAAKMISQITAPLRNLSRTAQAIAGGDFEQEAAGEGAREIRLLADSLNQMVRKVGSNIAQIYDLAYVDKVTQLPNREFFRREIAKSVSRVVRSGSSGALLFLDLDGFKKVNDTSGHEAGDKLLAEFARRITSLVREGDQVCHDPGTEVRGPGDDTQEASRTNTFARLGGDEFTILLPEIREETDAATVARRILQSLTRPFVIDGRDVTIGVSIGIATFPRDGTDYKTLLKHSDMAMYQAKEEGRNTFRFFSEELNAMAGRKVAIESELRQAIYNDELELHYQPKVDGKTGAVAGLEGLIRWNHPRRGMVSPAEFLPIAEDSGLIQPLGNYVIETACKRINAFVRQGRRLPIAVNISMQQFNRSDFALTVMDILAQTGADASLLELEVTESMAMLDPALTAAHLQTLKAVGIRFAIDDFGTGHSNIAELSRLNFDDFKVDSSFVQQLGDADGNGERIVRTIISMAHCLDYTTVAEGVETERQAELLKAAGCRVMQGFLFARPMAASEIDTWLDGRTLAPVRVRQGSKNTARAAA
ncbi:MAG: EAL domain-containing protein [Nitratireductor sp.]|nr:EAL domain-containing protein [Nitratireductor sp.]